MNCMLFIKLAHSDTIQCQILIEMVIKSVVLWSFNRYCDNFQIAKELKNILKFCVSIVAEFGLHAGDFTGSSL